MGIKQKVNDRAQDLTDNLMVQAQVKYIKWLMKKEKIDYAEALAIVEGRTEPLELEYILGYKLANPILQLALFNQPSKKARRQAAENFAAGLSEEERKLFYTEVFNEATAKGFKKAYKDAKKDKTIKTD